MFAEKGLTISRAQVIGKNRDSLRLILTNERGVHMTALLFRQAEEFMEDVKERFGEEEVRKMQMGLENMVKISVIYYPQINEYNGRVENQIVVNHYCF